MTSGILVINKEPNVTSRDVVNSLTKILNTKKIGHTGTLDPMATGVLVITINNATKLGEILTAEKKEYIASVKMGINTDTLDITGNILDTKDFDIDEYKLIKALNSFKGTYNQEVPIYSAVKINGKKLYEYARNNEDISLPSRMVTIYDIELLNYDNNNFTFKCTVSKGTYIRSLIRDICKKLDTVGVMSSLIRTKQGNFNIDDSYTINDIKNNNYKILTIEDALNDIYEVKLDENLLFKIRNGQIIDNIYKKDLVKFTYNNKVIALYKLYGDRLKPFKMFLGGI